VSDAQRIVDLFSRILKIFAEIFGFYPGMSIELVAAYCPSESAVGKFYETFHVPRELRRFFYVIEVPPSFVKSRMKSHNIEYFPEFDMKNIGIRRAHGEYILSMNADIIPPVGFFESIVKQAFSPLSYIRSRRLMTHYSRVPNIIRHWFINQHPIWQQQQYTNVCGDRRYYDKYERDGCGDFQGAHREMWHSVHGFLESEHVFHVDTGLSLDFSAFPSFLYVRVIGTNIHLQHPIESKRTSHFKFYADDIKNAIRQGVSTHMTERYARPNWGAAGVQFTTY
jgi:hypothetical protein